MQGQKGPCATGQECGYLRFLYIFEIFHKKQS